MTDVSQHFLDEVRRQLRGHKRLGEGAMAQLQDAELARSRIQFCSDSREAPRRNMRSRFTDFLTTDGEKPDRHRDREFGLAATTTRDELMRWWEQGLGVRVGGAGFPDARSRPAHGLHSGGAAHGPAGAQPCAGALCLSCGADCFSGQTPAFPRMEDVERAAR